MHCGGRVAMQDFARTRTATETPEETPEKSAVPPLKKQYQLVIEDARALGQRRDTLTTMFLSVITLILGAQGYLLLQSEDKVPGDTVMIVALMFFGLVLCRQWLQSLKSYDTILNYRYETLKRWEQAFPEQQRFYTRE